MGTMIIVASYVAVGYAEMSEAQRKNFYFRHRLIIFLRSWLTMSAAWAFPFCGEMYVYEALGKHQSPFFSRIVHAAMSTFILLILIFFLASLKSHKNIHIHRTRLLLLTAVTLSVGWSWEHSFDAALESIMEEQKFSHPHFVKFVVTFGFAAGVLPINVIYLKPIVLRVEEADKKWLTEDVDLDPDDKTADETAVVEAQAETPK